MFKKQKSICFFIISHDYGALKMHLEFYKCEYCRPKWEINF